MTPMLFKSEPRCPSVGGIQAALREQYSRDGWVYFHELRLGTGFRESAMGYIDGYAMNCWGDCETIAFEIKISRSDFKSEMKNPSKRRTAMAFSNYFFFVTPAGLLFPEEIPVDCGLIELRDDGNLRAKVSAVARERIRPTWGFVRSLARRVVGRGTESPTESLPEGNPE